MWKIFGKLFEILRQHDVIRRERSLSTLLWCAAAVYGLLLLLLIWIKIKPKLSERKNAPPKGMFYKELPMKTITLCFCHDVGDLEMPEQERIRQKEKNGATLLCIRYEAVKELTENEKEAQDSRRDNLKICRDFIKKVAKSFSGEFPCLFDRCGYVNESFKETPREDEEHKTFRLDMDWRMEEWLSQQETIVNSDGVIIGVRGIDERTIDRLISMREETDGKYSELVVPIAEESELRGMHIIELQKFSDPRFCKFKIKNGSDLCDCFFEYTEVDGYTGIDMYEKIRSLAEREGFGFKVIE